MDVRIKNDITESGNVGGDGSGSLGESTDDASSGETVDWSGEDSFHDVGWDSFLVAGVFDDPVDKVLGLVELLEVEHLVAVGTITEFLKLEHLVAVGTIAEFLESTHGETGDLGNPGLSFV